MAPHSSTLAWKIPWEEEPGSLQSMGSLRVRHDWATSISLFTFHFHALEKEMATHSSVFAWRIPGMWEPGGPPSMGLHRVGHDWSDLAAAAYSFSIIGFKKYNQSDFGVGHLVMSMCRIFSCVGKECLLWPVDSLGKTVSLCPTSFCTPKPNLPVTAGISWLPTFAFQSPMMKRTSLLGVSSRRSCRSS